MKSLALIAHDHQKQTMMEWAKKHRSHLAAFRLVTTGTTGMLLEKVLGVSVTRYQSGPLGGDQQIGAQIVEGNIDGIIFFWDPLAAMPHDPDVRALLRLATLWNIPMACNEASADFIISSPLWQQDYQRTTHLIEEYQKIRKNFSHPS
ncbi:MAG: methylglyoxal synthase [Oligoflexus sp.]